MVILSQSQRFILLSSLLTLFFITLVTGQDTGCCQFDGDGSYCFPTTQANCDPTAQWSPISCEQTSYCSVGCCVDGSDGTCSDSVGQASCDASSTSAFFQGAACETLSSCQPGCCQFGSSFISTSQASCELLITEYFPTEDYEDYWDPSITDEIQCLAQTSESNEGCCVTQAGLFDTACSWTVQESCVTSGLEFDDSTSEGFYTDVYCSNENLDCSCESQSYKSCGGENKEDAYWYDSCGNKEDLVEDCNAGSSVGSTICKEEGEDAYCQNIDCVDTVDFPGTETYDTAIGGYKKNGEAWCTYDPSTGGFSDRPGSIHYRHYCINGEEHVEECKDFREEICVQLNETKNGELFTYASCKVLDTFPKINPQHYNNFQDGDNTVLVHPKDNEFDDPKKKLVSLMTVDKGSDFWNGENEENTAQCKKGRSTCKVIYARETRWDSYECVKNCICQNVAYIKRANDYCRAFGDCGADINIVEEFTTGGMRVVWAGLSKGPSPKNLPGAYIDALPVYGVHAGMTANMGWMFNIKKGEVERLREDIRLDFFHWKPLNEFLEWLGEIPYIGKVFSWFFGGVFGGNTREKHVTVHCQPWQAPLGGDRCGECTDDPRYDEDVYENPARCTEYRCKSLGSSCSLINEGMPEQTCISTDPNDVTGPVISPNIEVMQEQTDTTGTNYVIDILPGSESFTITPDVDPLTPFTFSFTTNEPAACSWDTDVSIINYEQMKNPFDEGTLFTFEHQFSQGFDGGKTIELYIRCIDTYGNGDDTAPYIISFSVKKVPDFKPPYILDYILETGIVTSIFGGAGEASVPAGTTETGIVITLDEPVETCRWSPTNVPFSQMSINNSLLCGCSTGETSMCLGTVPDEEKEMCDYSEDGVIDRGSNECIGQLTGLQDNALHTYYISCIDTFKEYGGGCNIKDPAHLFEVTVTPELNIISIEPENDTYYTPSFVFRTITANGYDNGNAYCSYSDDTSIPIPFFETGTTVHTQAQTRIPGDYTYTITCEDAVGNTDTGQIALTLDIDLVGPDIINIYAQGSQLHIITREASTCYYDLDDPFFVFGEGIALAGTQVTHHTTDFTEERYFVQCWDIFENSGGTVTVYNTLS